MSASRTLPVPLAVLLVAGCNFAPKYTRPSTPSATPAAWKELTPADYANTDGWKQAEPRDDVIRDSWWEMFGDPLLNDPRGEGSRRAVPLAAVPDADHLAERHALGAARDQPVPGAARRGVGSGLVGQHPQPGGRER